MTARKVLIVEDDAALLRDPPDLVLLDVMLPKVNGYEICRQARSRRLSTPILMLSAKCLVDDVLRGSAVGADDYLTKPFGIQELLARAKHLSWRGAPERQ